MTTNSDMSLLQDLCERWASTARTSVVDLAGETAVEVEYDGTVVLDLRDAVSKVAVRLKPAQPGATARFTNLAPSTELAILNCADHGMPSTTTVELDLSVQGIVEIWAYLEAVSKTALFVAQGSGAQVFHRKGRLVVDAESFSTKATLTVSGGALEVSGHIPSVSLMGDCTLISTRGSDAAIGRVVVVSESKLTLGDERALNIHNLSSPNGAQLSLATSTSSECRMRVRDIERGVILHARSNKPIVSGVRRASGVRLVGGVNLEVSAGGICSALAGETLEAWKPALAAGENAIVTELEGSFTLGSVRGATLAGGANGFLISGVSGARFGRNGVTEDPLAQSILRGFRIPDGLTGRRLLTKFSSVFQMEPARQHLPGSDMTLWRGISIRSPRRSLSSIFLGAAPDDRGAAAMHLDSELMRELHRLVKEHGAPGASRTKVGWCSYRLRHATTTGGMERFALTGYRMLGYGERPFPSLATWLMLSMLMAGIVLGFDLDFSQSGFRNLFAETLVQAGGPLAAVMRSGTAPLQEDWHYMLRALVAVPLITAALSVRNYVKGAE